MKPDASSTKYFRLILVMQIFILLMLFGSGMRGTTVMADGIPDAGAQRDQMLEQMKATNEKLDKIVTLLSSGDLQVKLHKADDSSGHP